MKLISLIVLVITYPCFGQGLFPPSAGQIGTTAVHKDSSAIVAWVTSCDLIPGYVNIADPSLGFVSFGVPTDATGPSNPLVLSLGDSGSAIVSFEGVIFDGPGPDFAVFENSFSDDFLELAFVEVSSDGVTFVRFPATCNLQDSVQIGPFGSSDATEINNLAGKYRAQFGTPFDLLELAGHPNLDINQISHVKIIDCVGSLQPDFASHDQYGRRINDPYPSPFSSGGFDLDALGVIHYHQYTGLSKHGVSLSIFPNPTTGLISVHCNGFIKAEILTMEGRLIQTSERSTINCSSITNGYYIINVLTEKGIHNQIFIKR